ncbi:large conductance mechanosensitive channel protein MscL [Gordonia sp. TBRC 11910]|uniref:Large-conductance mechanosensitive channel n=1 Tax=Gordonia asplenii TaxID=2725283 RepID=A0A848KVT5_9ACTN|nr:large conductance mechanosensitive channel protein MscL [Gordonia asplenii]NMO00563.1 large conductance mechanosensitive channel protein MscL [Gordonia asplenii]
MLKGFKEFILKGNVVELATAVIIGAAFTAIVTAFTEKVIQPLINAIPIGTDKAEGLGFKITDNANTFVNIGAVITAALNFLIVAAVVYFIIVLPYNKLAALAGFDTDSAVAKEVVLLTEIRNILDPKSAGGVDADVAARAAGEVLTPPVATSVFERGPDFGSGPANPSPANPSPLGRGPVGPPPQSGPIPPVGPPQSGPFQAGGPPAYAPRPDGPSVQPSRDFGGPPSGAIPLPTERFQSGPSVQPSQPQGPPPAAPPGGGYSPPSPAPGPGQGNYPPPQGNYPPQGQGNNAPPNFPPSGGFPAQPGDPDAPGRHSR